ncbi:MAG TPA: hypothetical protein VEK07_15310 [Polyangiaceae bacterium]|nr:hypothetical protein [Polyangiaceae bacterium]
MKPAGRAMQWIQSALPRAPQSSGGKALRRTSVLAALLAGCAVVAPAQAQVSPGTWTRAPTNPATGGEAFGLWLLTDGTVLSHGSALNNWVILTPDSKGSYANGTWKTVASSHYARGGAQEHVLRDGRFFEAGGEYIYAWPDGGSATDYNTVEIYDPVANTWTLEAPGLYGDIGDTGSATLSNGTIFDSTRVSNQDQIYNPATNVWTPAASSPIGSGDENSWASLQNGGVLAVGYATAGAAIYNPLTNTWTQTQVPSGWNTGDTGGISQMFDGRVFVYGLQGISYIYTPGATPSDPGSWALGPAMLDGDEAEDEYSDTLPNGMVMGALVQMTYGPGVILQEFDPTTNTVMSVTPPPDMGNPYPIDYLNLPNGQVMVTAESGDADWLLTPSGAPQDAWRPTVTSVVYDGDGGPTYTLTGTQLSGLINGGDEGDDMTMAENYPIVWLTDAAGDVYYCRSFNFSNMMPSAGSTPETCQFTTPPNLAAGTYDLYVSAVGVPSKTPITFVVGVGAVELDGGTAAGDAAAGGAAADGGTEGGAQGGASSVADAGASASSSVASGGAGSSGSTSPGAVQGNEDTLGKTSSPAGCGCGAVGTGSNGREWAALLAVGAAVVGAARRRRSGARR